MISFWLFGGKEHHLKAKSELYKSLNGFLHALSKTSCAEQASYDFVSSFLLGRTPNEKEKTELYGNPNALLRSL